jgi:hypothetical protein
MSSFLCEGEGKDKHLENNTPLRQSEQQEQQEQQQQQQRQEEKNYLPLPSES